MSDFDWVAAEAGRAACDRAVVALDEHAARFDASRVAAVADWTGPHRRADDADVARLHATVDEARWSLLHAWAALAAAEQAARADQLDRLARRGPS